MQSENKAMAFYDNHIDKYSTYSNGAPCALDVLDISTLSQDYQFASGDVKTWSIIQNVLDKLVRVQRNSGRRIRLLDVGCGDGIWALRIAHYLLKNDVKIFVECVDISEKMTELANRNLLDFAERIEDKTKLDFSVSTLDLTKNLPSTYLADPFDIVLCLHTVLNHVPKQSLEECIQKLVLVSHGHLIFSVKPALSKPTFYGDNLSNLIHFKHQDGHLHALSKDGKFHMIPSNLISTNEIRDILSKLPCTSDLIGIDAFKSRFGCDERWVSNESPTAESEAACAIFETLDKEFCRHSALLDYANHLVVITERRHSVVSLP